MEFHNVFRHAVYCRSLQKFLVLPEGGGYSRVDYVRVKVEISAADWRVWQGKGLRYWHMNSYFLPMCWMGAGPDQSEGDGDDLVPRREDMVEWMLDGIAKGCRYHNSDEEGGGGEGATRGEAQVNESTQKRQKPDAAE